MCLYDGVLAAKQRYEFDGETCRSRYGNGANDDCRESRREGRSKRAPEQRRRITCPESEDRFVVEKSISIVLQ